MTDLEQLTKDIQDAGQEWVRARLTADQLDEDQKNFLAALINSLEQTTADKQSEAKLERLARGSKEFRDYVARMCIARAAALSKKVRYEALQNLFEAKRSDLSFEKVKIEKGIYHTGG